MLYENGEFERIRPHLTPLEYGIIFDGIPEGAISRKVGLIWGIPVNKIPGMENYNFMADHGKKDPISWASRGKMLEFKPIEVADRISPRAILYIAAEKDPYIPLDQVTDIYERTKEPKKLWVILGISHWHLYEELYVGQIFEQPSDWLRQHLT